MTALIIGLIVLAAGLGAAKGAIDGILHPEEVNYLISFITIVLITMVVKLILGKYTEKLNSGALKAAGIDAKNDALVSAVTLLAVVIYFVTDINVDAYAGGLISLAVIKAGFDILKETISTILGERIDSKLLRPNHT